MDKYIERQKQIIIAGIFGWLLIGLFWLVYYFIQFIFFLYGMFCLVTYGVKIT